MALPQVVSCDLSCLVPAWESNAKYLPVSRAFSARTNQQQKEKGLGQKENFRVRKTRIDHTQWRSVLVPKILKRRLVAVTRSLLVKGKK